MALRGGGIQHSGDKVSRSRRLGAGLIMAITLVGTPQVGSNFNGGNVTLTFSTTPSTGDVVIVKGGVGYRAAALTAPGTDYVPIALNDAASSVQVGAWYKRMGVSPDSNVLCYGNGNASSGVVYLASVWRGVDATTALDAAATTSGPTTSTNPDCASITTVTPGAIVIAFSGSRIDDSTPGTISGYSNHYQKNQTESPYPLTAAMATKEIAAAGTENPGAWDTWGSGLWFAITIAIRPAVAATSSAWFAFV
jgi:hypothetical protein